MTTTSDGFGPSILAGFYHRWWMVQRLRQFNEELLLRYGIMGMEKRGVVGDENEAPAKEAADKAVCAKPVCCQGACGTDPLSKAAEAVADKAKPAQ